MSTDLWRIPPQDADGEHVEGTRWDSALGRWIEAGEFEDLPVPVLAEPAKPETACRSGEARESTKDATVNADSRGGQNIPAKEAR